MSTPNEPSPPPEQAGWGAPPGGYRPVPGAYGQPAGYPPPPPGYVPPGYQPGWSPPGYGPPAGYGTNGMAIASLVLGILWMYWLGSVLALVFGYIARNQIKANGQQGAGLALAGIILGWVGIAFLVLFAGVFMALGPSGMWMRN